MSSRTTEDELRAALAPDATITPLDPARVIAGARRRRKVRTLATAAVAVVAVAGIATGGLLGRSLADGTEPADPALTTATPSRTPIPSAKQTVSPGRTPSNTAPLTPAACLAEITGHQGPGTGATQQSLLNDALGKTVVLADSRYWVVCDNTTGGQVSARAPQRLQRPSVQDADAFAVATDVLDRPEGQREFFWAGGMLPSGVATVRYTFPDGKSVDAAVAGSFWLLRHLATTPPAGPSANQIRVRLLSGGNAVLADFRLDWGTQTCAQISHGC
jgi:hypothetical protein